MRAEDVARALKKRFPRMARSKVRLIARTETAKAETAITKARAEDIGITWCQWLTSEDERVRPSHKNLDKVLMRFSDPPQPEQLIGKRTTLGHGLAGEFPQCRCVTLPLVTLDEIRFPARVYANGGIRRMTRKQFEQLARIPVAA